MLRTILTLVLLAPLPALAHGLHLDARDGHSHWPGIAALAGAVVVGLVAAAISRHRSAAASRKRAT